MRKPLFRLLVQSYLAFVVAVLAVVLLFVAVGFRAFALSHARVELEAQAGLIVPALRAAAPDLDGGAVQALCRTWGEAQNTRITVIAPDGTVLGDTERDPALMENHADRPEVREALRGLVGESRRYSNTLRRELMYVAVPIPQGGRIVAVVRTSLPVKRLRETWRTLQRDLLLPAFSVAVLAAIFGTFVSRRIARPAERLRAGAERFARGDLSFRLDLPDQRELAELGDSMNRMASELQERMDHLARQAETEQRMLSSMVEGVIAVNTGERVILINRAAVRLLGIRGSDLEGKAVEEVIRQAELLRLLARLLREERRVEGELALAGADGERHLEVQGVSLRSADDEPMGAMLVVHDVTRLRRLEKVQRDFVANVSHELKTPTTSIRGFVETLADGAIDDPENARHFLGIVARQTERLDAIIEDLLALARVEATVEEHDLQTGEVRLAEVLDDAVQSYQPKADEGGVTLTSDCAPDLTVRANRLLLGQAIGNLIDNAVRYSARGQPVEISASREADEIVVAVKDHGTGIAREHLPRLFERFYRVDKARSRQAGGTGLGLSIVKHITTAHGGRVSVESTPGKGSLFRIHLPKHS